MDAGETDRGELWFLRVSEKALRGFAMGLVLTGQMLPAGAISAEEVPPGPPSFKTPATSGLSPVGVEAAAPAEETTSPQGENDGEATTEPLTADDSEEALPPAAESEEAPATTEASSTEASSATEDAPATEPASETEKAQSTPMTETETTEETPAPTDEAPASGESQSAAETTEEPAMEAAPAPESLPTDELVPDLSLPDIRAGATSDKNTAVGSSDPTKHQLGDWTMTIRPGPITPRISRANHTPVVYEGGPANQNNVTVPVHVTVNNMTSQNWPWATPWAAFNDWNSPSAAYLLQRPQPYWQLRGDFYHLRPFIPGLWY